MVTNLLSFKRWRLHPFSLNNNHLFLGFIILFYLINGIIYLRAQSLTFDEPAHLSYAARLIKGHPERINQMDNSKMPVSVLNLIPRIISQLRNPGLKKTDNGASDVFAGRYVTLLISVFVILLVFRWTGELYGDKAALFSAFLISFCPNMIANAGLVTTDSYSMLFLMLNFYLLWKFCKSPRLLNFVLLSVSIGASQLVKQSLFHLYILVPIVLVVYYVIFKPRIIISRILYFLILFFFINWLIINLGYGFKETNTEVGQFHFLSRSFQLLQQWFPAWLPVPLPKAFISGLDLSKYYDQIGGGDYIRSTFGNITILGKSSTGGSFWYYYFVSFLFKTPVASLLFICTGIVLMIRNRTLTLFFKNEFFLLAPVLYFLVFMSFFYKTQIGIRQMIFIYPFLYIICGSLFYWLNGRTPIIITAALCLFLIISVLGYWRNYYPYTNELIADKKMAYKYVGNANLEFNQDQDFFKAFLRTHPEVQMAPAVPAQGTFLINVNDYMDIWNLHSYSWLNKIQPSGQVAYSGLLIKITPDDLKMNPAPIH